jgi:hypothetical protein
MTNDKIKVRRQGKEMKKDIILWMVLGAVLGITVMFLIHDLTSKSDDEPLQSGNISYDYHWPGNDSSRVQVQVDAFKEKSNAGSRLREYEITARSEAFTVRLSVLGREVDSARILEARFRGQTQVTVYRDRILPIPKTPGLTSSYQPQAGFHKPKEKWIEAEILAGAYLLPPYSPIIAAGIGIRRLPLLGKLPPLTVGAGWFGAGLGAYMTYRL